MAEVNRTTERHHSRSNGGLNSGLIKDEVVSLQEKVQVDQEIESVQQKDGGASSFTPGFSKFMLKRESLLEGQLSSNLSPRRKFLTVMILKSLNGTFDTKYLAIPFKPDGMKLGRPVASNANNNSNSNNSSTNNNNSGNNNNSNNNNSNNNGNPNNGNPNNGNNNNNNNSRNRDMHQPPMVKSDNGYFDSRVLSRNHAMLTCDPNTGTILIHDLKSSNGTFVNGNRIGQSDVPLKIGDMVDLGTDIDSKSEHRKISAYIEDISIVPLTCENTCFWSDTRTLDVEDDDSPSIRERHPSILKQAAYETTLFGDSSHLDLEDTILGLESELLSGIYINNSIGTSSELSNVLRLLATEIILERRSSLKIKSAEEFLNNFTSGFEYLKKIMMEHNDRQLATIQINLKKELCEQHDSIVEEYEQKMKKIEKRNKSLKESFEIKRKENNETIRNINNEIEDLKTMLEVERYKNSQRLKKDSKIKDNAKTTLKKDDDEKTEINSEKIPERGRRFPNGFFNTILLFSGISFIIIVYSFNIPSK
ncbi:hypothetical protein Kpol_340p5 [Vanderwaltozyma polyspora DSM 70294]|uniref:FHA domain-containing protein n=1 Tax=Vanderwaltozyma polyspora (strain ATCC 22028 / DSM 70294 / BCRC 21397 / CBS 2163 / NBRC 10782 / NRRL Y-8283 / UCD 57-17) TaxID=436907 RepID=A7TSV0_VANPO|nr:uncharacterized protein Kpol_340p5 [Vanderwaltozyma polyspora DSM 70294]EDO14658.1 hypothetical protein Kpol_340p5 [Vanderwaltozyma polyspora DSM 70294]